LLQVKFSLLFSYCNLILHDPPTHISFVFIAPDISRYQDKIQALSLMAVMRRLFTFATLSSFLPKMSNEIHPLSPIHNVKKYSVCGGKAEMHPAR
jgi:hypothetical protein